MCKITFINPRGSEEPRSCDKYCLFHRSSQSMEYCDLKKMMEMKDCSCHCYKDVMAGYEYFKDPNCPFEYGKTYEV